MRRVIVLAALAGGCTGNPIVPSAGDEDGDGTAGVSDTSEDSALTHGDINVQFTRSPAASESPFTGTAQISVTAVYDSCFMEFYAENPNWSFAGVDGVGLLGTLADGGEGWRDRLCVSEPGLADCAVESFDQELDVATQLTVTYNVTGDPENRFLRFGPLPLVGGIPEFMCDADSPRMQFNAQSIRGFDASGTTIWRGEVLDVDMATPGQGKAVVVRARRE